MVLLSRVLFALLLVVGAAACGDDDVGVPVSGEVEEDTASAEQEVVDLRTAVEDYAAAVIEGDVDRAVELHSEACAEVDVTEPPDLDEITAPEPAVVAYQAQLEEGQAAVSYQYDIPERFEVEDERWVREDGEWKWDNC